MAWFFCYPFSPTVCWDCFWSWRKCSRQSGHVLVNCPEVIDTQSRRQQAVGWTQWKRVTSEGKGCSGLGRLGFWGALTRPRVLGENILQKGSNVQRPSCGKKPGEFVDRFSKAGQWARPGHVAEGRQNLESTVLRTYLDAAGSCCAGCSEGGTGCEACLCGTLGRDVDSRGLETKPGEQVWRLVKCGSTAEGWVWWDWLELRVSVTSVLGGCGRHQEMKASGLSHRVNGNLIDWAWGHQWPRSRKGDQECTFHHTALQRRSTASH